MFGNIFGQKKDGTTDPNQQSAQDPNQQQSTSQFSSPPDGSQQQYNSSPPPGGDQQPSSSDSSSNQQSPTGPNQTGENASGQQQPPAQGTDAPGQPSQSSQPGQNQPGTPGQNDSSNHADMSALSHLDPRATQVLSRSQEETRRIKQQYIEPDQLLLGLLYDEQIYKLLNEFQVDGGALSKEIQSKEKMGVYKGQPTLSKTSQGVFDQSYKDAKMRGSNFVSPEDLLLVLFSPNVSTASYLQSKGLKKEALVEKISKNPNSTYAHKTILEKYGIDLTAEAREGRLDPVAGRDKEVDRIVHILLRRTKNNPIIIGDTGVGKTAIVEGLAQMIVAGRTPKDLNDKRIFQLDVASLIAGASHRGEFEERLRGVINEVLGSNNTIVLFIDEIHSLMGTGEGEGVSAANIIKPHLARGHFQLIGATTTTEYRKNFEKDKAFERRFQPVLAEEPSEENAFEMMKVLRPKYEKFHRVTMPDDVLKQCVKLSKKYIGERFLPDKAVDLLDEAAAEVKLQADAGKRGDMTVKKGDVEKVVSAWTGIPVTKLTEDESEKLLKLEDRIHKRLVDQEEAVVSVSEAVRRGRIGLASGTRPIASFIFLGPTGVGKTELAKCLAELMFGRDDAMARLDMSEYMEKHEVAKIIGAPPGYVGYEEGGILTEAVRKKPYSIVLLDEIEKAHPDVFNILLQLLEDGRLTDNKGNVISFKNTIVICTSNIGSSLIQQQLGNIDPKVKMTAEQMNKQFADLQKLIREEITKFLRPEVLNRFDEVVIFKPLRPEHMAGIVRLGIAKTAALLKEQGYNLQITEKAVAKLAKDGYDPVYGARPLCRLIQTAIENPIALAIISKKFAPGDTIVIDYNDTANEFVFLKGGSAAATEPLNDEQFKVMLVKIANPDGLTDDSEKRTYTDLHEKVMKASTGGTKWAATILSTTAATSVAEVKTLRAQLEEAKTKGDELAKEILALAETVAQQAAVANHHKKVLLEIVNPTLAPAAKKEEFTQLHDKLTQASQTGNTLAASILAITTGTPPEVISKIMDDLNHGKDQDDELATELLAAVNSEVADEAEKEQAAEPTVKFKKILKQVINPLYAANPENKEKFTQLYDKISAANSQNHPIAASILSITDITSDADIAQLESQLKQAKEQGDPLAAEILETIEAAMKHDELFRLKTMAGYIINPLAIPNPAYKDKYTELHDKVTQASQQNNQVATSILSVSDATSDADLASLNDAITQGVQQNNDIAKLIADALLNADTEEFAPKKNDVDEGLSIKPASAVQQPQGPGSSQTPDQNNPMMGQPAPMQGGLQQPGPAGGGMALQMNVTPGGAVAGQMQAGMPGGAPMQNNAPMQQGMMPQAPMQQGQYPPQQMMGGQQQSYQQQNIAPIMPPPQSQGPMGGPPPVQGQQPYGSGGTMSGGTAAAMNEQFSDDSGLPEPPLEPEGHTIT